MAAATLTDGERRELVRELALRGQLVVTVASDSMAPTVCRGTKVRIGPAGRVRAGDVVLFETVDRRDLVLHRVVLTVPGASWFVHCGDTAVGPGPRRARKGQIVGRGDLPRRLPRVRGVGRLAVRALARATHKSRQWWRR